MTQAPVRVLLVDDHPAMLRQLVELLPEGFQVVAALQSGFGIREAVAAHSPDLIILDITLPGPSGIQLASQLRLAGCMTTIIFLTVHVDPDYARAALAAGPR